jgi:hypothetical protein
MRVYLHWWPTEVGEGEVMAERSGSEDRSTGGSTATSARGGAKAAVEEDDGRGKNVSALAGFRLPWPQGFELVRKSGIAVAGSGVCIE